jgi:membrane protein
LDDRKTSKSGRGGRLALKAAPWIALAAMTALWPRPKVKAGMSMDIKASPESFEAVEPRRGRLAEHPHHIPALGWRDIAWRTYREVSRDRLTIVAASVTFFMLLAIFPGIGVFVALFGIFADVSAAQRELASLATVIPTEVIKIVSDQMVRLAGRERASLSLAFVISFLLSLWSAKAGMASMFDGLNIAYDETEKRPYLRRTVITYLFTLLSLVFMALMTAILVAAPVALHRLGFSQVSPLWAALRWAVLLVVAAGAFSIIYRYGPSRERARWRWVTPGAALASAFWLGGSLGFSWYVNHIAHYDVTYGSLGAVIAFMMWIWFSVMIVLIGAELNAEIEHQTAHDSTTGPPASLGGPGARRWPLGKAQRLAEFVFQS